MHYFGRFKCNMNTSTNLYKTDFVDSANRIMGLHHKNSQTIFPKRPELNDMVDIWWPPICLSRFLQCTVHWFSMGIEMIRIFCVRCFSIVICCILLSGWCIRKGCWKVCRIFFKVMELTVYLDLNGNDKIWRLSK